MTSPATRLHPGLFALLFFPILLGALGARASGSKATVETARVSGEWGVWTDWYWPFNDTTPPNLYGTNECLSRYDAFTGANSQTWETDNHGPTNNPPAWVGHCHAWCGASVWEDLPTTNKVFGGVTFRPRDQAGLITECYYNDTFATEISEYLPSPGLFWRYLREEIKGENSIHGHAMALIGNLTPTLGEIWNFPIYQYEVVFTLDSSGTTYSGTITVWCADDGNPSYATSLGLSSVSFSYPFSAASLDASGTPVDSGNWVGSSPAQYPTTLWRPYYAGSWTNYLANLQLDASHLSQILDALPTQCSNTIATSASPPGGGSVSRGGLVNCGTNVTVCATPNAGYSFAYWTENSNVVSTASCYTFTANTSYSLVANFTLGPPVLSAARVANEVVIHWGTNWPAYQLEYSTNAQPAQVWTPVTNVPTLAGGLYFVTNPVAGACKFYRLRLP